MDRGFTFRHDSRLDMRMNKSSSITAADLLATMKESDMADMFYEFGELTNSRKIARAIGLARMEKPIISANDISNVIGKFAPFRQENKFYAKVFQALRIAVNHEIEYLKEMLGQALELLNQGGRLAVITYHSLEDRVVKNFMRTGNFTGEGTKDFFGNPITPFRLITKKPVIPGEDEIARNNRARSAKLRIAEKL
jgi:16S rRNA (cytosine1402-N4)-methyltransferase